MRRKVPADGIMPASVQKRRAAVYTRVSTDERLDQAYNSLDAQRDACEAYIVSQRAEGWTLVRDRYDDGGFSESVSILMRNVRCGVAG
jgi:DNA invertase Pin-like site-specific DNA recombinase